MSIDSFSIDVVAQPLAKAIQLLQEKNISYQVTIAVPSKTKFELELDGHYVIRQRIDANNTYCLVAASRMKGNC